MILVQNGLLPQYYNGRTSENSDLLIVYALEASSQCLQALFDRMAELMNRHSTVLSTIPIAPQVGWARVSNALCTNLLARCFPYCRIRGQSTNRVRYTECVDGILNHA